MGLATLDKLLALLQRRAECQAATNRSLSSESQGQEPEVRMVGHWALEG